MKLTLWHLKGAILICTFVIAFNLFHHYGSIVAQRSFEESAEKETIKQSIHFQNVANLLHRTKNLLTEHHTNISIIHSLRSRYGALSGNEDGSNSNYKDSTSTSKLYIVTYATHEGSDDRFCRAVESAIMNQVDLVILGWGQKWIGLSQKLEAALEFAKSLKDNDILLFVDAFDIMFTKSASETNLKQLFQSLDAPILFSAECGCWPHVMEDLSICLTKYPPSPTPYRYLNSGAWMGYARPATLMLEEIQRLAGDNWATANDQKLVADMFIDGRHKIKLDYSATIFLSVHMTLDPPLPRCNPSEDLYFDSASGMWINSRTKTKPSIFHFNGGGKTHHLNMEAQGWHKDILKNSKSELNLLANKFIKMPTHESKGLLFNDICSTYLHAEYQY